MRRLFEENKHRFYFDVYSGGMILPQEPKPIALTAQYALETYKDVEALSGVNFGQDYLWHVRNPEDSDWYPHSLKPATALCAFREYYPDGQVQFASDLQLALFSEGRDLTDSEAYRHLIEKYQLPEKEFLEKLTSPEYIEKAQYDFALVKQLHVTGFPTLFLQVSESKLFMLSQGYSSFETVQNRLDEILLSIGD